MLDFKRVGEKIKQLFCTSKIKTNIFSKTSSTGILKLKNKLHYFYVLFTPMMCDTKHSYCLPGIFLRRAVCGYDLVHGVGAVDGQAAHGSRLSPSLCHCYHHARSVHVCG